MHEFLNNRYTQLAGLTLVIGTLFMVLIWLIFTLLNFPQMPLGLLALGCYLASGAIVAKYLANRIF